MKHYHLSLLCVALAAASCTNDNPNPEPEPNPEPVPTDTVKPTYEPGEVPQFNYAILPWDGTTATDITADVVNPADADTYHEKNAWEQVVKVIYTNDSVTVSGQKSPVTFTVSGCNLNLNLGEAKAKVIVTGSCTDGSLRITGEHRHMLELQALDLKSTIGPAINDQNKKRVFVHLSGDTRLEDAPTYAPALTADEDRKGCFFAEGHVIISGDGVLEITGRQRHGLATDGFLTIRPGVTLVVHDAAKNAIAAKGSAANANAGITVMGGYIYANTSAPAGKVLKTDLNTVITGGALNLNCSGDPAIDPDDNTLSSAACIKSGLTTTISGADITMTATGHGGKGINSTGAITMTSGTATMALAGSRVEDSGDSATPKAVKTEGNLSLLGGTLNVSAIGEGAVGVETTGTSTIEGTVAYVFGRSDAWLSNGRFAITSGTFICGGGQITTPAEVTNPHFSTTGLTVAAPGLSVLVGTDSDKVYATYDWPVAMNGASFYFSSPELPADSSFELLTIE